MASEFHYDDSNLQKLFSELTPKYRLRAIKGALRGEANRVRKVVVKNVRHDFRPDADLERGVRAVVYKDRPGFKVTVMFTTGKRAKGMHFNRRKELKPVLFWASLGTGSRRTRGKIGLKGYRRGRYTGSMPQYPFMAKSDAETTGTVTANLRKAIVKNVERTAKRYGAKT